jgi:translation elongation factor EF-1beta
MKEIVWSYNKELGFYDIKNEFTVGGDEGNLEVIKSKILIKLNTFQGEWADDLNFGIPLIANNQNNTDPNAYLQIIVNELLEIENVESVDVSFFEYTESSRLFSASFDVSTVYGKISIGV